MQARNQRLVRHLRCFCVVLMAGTIVTAYADVASSEENQSTALVRAQWLLERGVIFEAIRELETHVRTFSDDTDAHMLLARSLVEVRRGRQAFSHAMKVLRLDPQSEDARRIVTEVRLQIGRDLDTSDPDKVLDYARLCAQPGTYDRAEHYYRLYFELEDQPAVRREFAEMLSWAGRYEAAARAFEDYLQAAPGDIDAWYRLGRLYNTLSRFDDAAEVFSMCLRSRPDEIEIRLDLARALAWTGREGEARRVLEDARRRAPDYDEPVLQLATLARTSGQLNKSLNLYQEVITLNPDNREAQHWIEYLKQGNGLRINWLEDHLAGQPDARDKRRELVELYLADGQVGPALRELYEALARDPMDREARDLINRLREDERQRLELLIDQLNMPDERDLPRRIEALRAWLIRYPDDHRSRIRLADLLVRSHDLIGAIEVLEPVAETGNYRPVQETLTRLRFEAERQTRALGHDREDTY